MTNEANPAINAYRDWSIIMKVNINGTTVSNDIDSIKEEEVEADNVNSTINSIMYSNNTLELSSENKEGGLIQPCNEFNKDTVYIDFELEHDVF